MLYARSYNNSLVLSIVTCCSLSAAIWLSHVGMCDAESGGPRPGAQVSSFPWGNIACYYSESRDGQLSARKAIAVLILLWRFGGDLLLRACSTIYFYCSSCCSLSNLVSPVCCNMLCLQVSAGVCSVLLVQLWLFYFVRIAIHLIQLASPELRQTCQHLAILSLLMGTIILWTWVCGWLQQNQTDSRSGVHSLRLFSCTSLHEYLLSKPQCACLKWQTACLTDFTTAYITSWSCQFAWHCFCNRWTPLWTKILWPRKSRKQSLPNWHSAYVILAISYLSNIFRLYKHFPM